MYKIVLLFILLACVTGCSTVCSPVKTVANDSCNSCHRQIIVAFADSVHGQNNVSCSDCHQNLGAHLKNTATLPTITYSGDSCAACHTEEHQQWLSSPHAKIPLDLFPQDMRVMQCMKCHSASGFAYVLNSGEDFKSAWGPLPSEEPEAVTCTTCHSPHKAAAVQMLRLPKGELCSTCHGGKWQNQILTGSPPSVYKPPGSHSFSAAPAAGPPHPFGELDYSPYANHPHNSGERCAACHMAKTPGVDMLGGHTFSMKTTPDGKQNTAACIACHEGADSYDINGKQTVIQQELLRLETILKERNNGQLPGNQPGTCNQCHKGGSLPFDHDPEFVLSNAYETYKLVERDKSFGIHNAPFALQLLRDAIYAIEKLYRP